MKELLLKHTSIYLIARGLPGVINLAVLFLYTRLLSPEQYGIYTLVLAGVEFSNVLLFQWIRYGFLRFYPVFEKQNKIQFISTVTFTYIGLFVITGLLGFLIWSIGPIKDVPFGIWFIGIILLWVLAGYEITLDLKRSQLRPKQYAQMTILKALIVIVLGGTLACLGWGAWGALIGLLTGLGLAAILFGKNEFRYIHIYNFDRKVSRQIFSYGLPLTPTFALNFVIHGSDRILLGMIIGAEAAGFYAVGYEFAQKSLGILMTVVNLAAFPLAVRSLEFKNREAANQQIAQNLTALLAIALPGAAILIILAPNLSDLFLGNAYRESASILIPWVTLGVLFSGIEANYCDLAFQLSRHTFGRVWVMLTASIVNVGLNIWLIPRIGFLGAAYSTAIAYGIAMLLSLWLGRKYFTLPFPMVETTKIFIAVTAMVVILLPLSSYQGKVALIIQLISGSLIYIIVFWILNILGLKNKIIGLVKTKVNA